MVSLYEELGVDPKAKKSEIRKAYRKKAKQSHPDKGGNVEEFKRVSKAYSLLMDDEKRDRYDRTGVEETKFDRNGLDVSAMEQLSRIFDKVVGEVVSDQALSMRDVVSHTTNLIKRELSENKSMILEMERMVLSIKMVLSRLEWDGEGEADFLRNAVEYRLREALTLIDASEMRNKVLGRAAELIKHYSYRLLLASEKVDVEEQSMRLFLRKTGIAREKII